MYRYEKELTLDMFDESGVRLLYRQHILQNQVCFTMHFHAHIELLRIHEGSISVRTDTQRISAKAGDAVIFPPNLPHSGFAEKSFAVYSTVLFDIRSFYNKTDVSKALLEPLFERSSELPLVSSSPSVLSALDALIDAKQQSATSLSVMSCTYALLGELCSIGNVLQAQPSSYGMVNKAINYIEQNFSHEISVSDLCREVGYSPTYFSQKFKEIVGIPPSSYIKIYRVEHGYRLIKEGLTNIESVAALCGFADQNYFTRCFKAHFGHPPTFYC